MITYYIKKALFIVAFIVMLFGICCLDSEGIYETMAYAMTFGGLAGMFFLYLLGATDEA